LFALWAQDSTLPQAKVLLPAVLPRSPLTLQNAVELLSIGSTGTTKRIAPIAAEDTFSISPHALRLFDGKPRCSAKNA